MKNQIIGVFCVMIMSVGAAQAALIDRGSGLIYDDDLDITWLQDANLAGQSFNWQGAVDWADNLVFGGFDDWRLPTTTQPDPTCSSQDAFGPGQDAGFNCTGSEMGHLFNVENISAASPGL